MNFDEKNSLNFDFDTPIDEIETADFSTDEVDVFDLAALTSANERKNSSLKRSKINEDIIKDRAIEREQEIFDLNRERHASQNASNRTAPHAITAEELMRGKSSFKLNHDINVNNTSNFELDTNDITNDEVETNDVADDNISVEKNYSNAAQKIFEKLRNRKIEEKNNDDIDNSDEQATYKTEEVVNPVIKSKLSNSNNENDIDKLAFNNEDTLVFEDIFDDDSIDEDELEVAVYNKIDLIHEEPAGTKERLFSDFDDVIDDENDNTDRLIQTIGIDDDIDSVDTINNTEISDTAEIPVQTLFVQYDNTNEETVTLNDNVDDVMQYSFNSIQFFDDNTDKDDGFTNLDAFVNDDGYIDEIEFNDNYDLAVDTDKDSEEFDEFDDEYDYQNDDLDNDIGFDLPELEHFEDGEFNDMPNPVYNDFNGLDDEIFTDISPKTNFINPLDSDYLGSVEYNDIDDVYDVDSALNKGKKSNLIKMSLSFVVSLILICLSTGIFVSSDFFGSIGYWITSAVLGIALLVINFNSSMSLLSIKNNEFSLDLLPTTLTVAAIIQGWLGILSVNVGNIGFVLVSSVIFGLYNLVKYIRVCDIISNFDMVCNEENKNIASFIDQPESNKIIDSSNDIDYRIIYQKSTVNIANFIKNSMSLGAFEKHIKRYYISAVAASLILAVLTAVIGKNAGLIIFGLCFGLSISSPLSALIMTIISIRRVNGTLKNYRVKLFGFSSAENIDNANVVSINASDLFNKNNVKLYNIKTFGGLSLDKAIVDASALLSAANSPMMNIFNDIAGGEAIPQTDSVTYEDRMGLSGWVGGRKTLIGNRMIMETHGIEVPQIDIDKKIVMNGYFPVYMSSEGKLSALFVVGYNADPSLAYYVKKAYNLGLTLLVKTCDPNISEDMVADYFGIDRDSVKITSHESEIMMDKANSSNDATIVYDNAKGYFNGIISSINLIKNSRYSVIAQFIITALAFMIFGLSAATGAFGLISYISLIIYNIICLAFVYIFNSKYH